MQAYTPNLKTAQQDNKKGMVTAVLTTAATRKMCKSYHYSLSHILNTLLHLPPCLLLGVEDQKECQKLQNK